MSAPVFLEKQIINKLLTYEKFLQVFENTDVFDVDETMFYFDDDSEQTEHYLGFIEKYNKPYWAGYCDFSDGCEFKTAYELFNAKIYDKQSLKERWKHIVFINIGGLPVDYWLDCYKSKL